MKTNNSVKIRVSFPAWSDAVKSWYFLVYHNEDFTGWSSGFWFPKKVCTLEEPKEGERFAVLTLPEWLYNKLFEGKEKPPII